jgi:hypothetical protein
MPMPADTQTLQILNYRVDLEKTVRHLEGKDYDCPVKISCWNPLPNQPVRVVHIFFLDTEDDVPEDTKTVAAQLPDGTMQHDVLIFYKASSYAWFIDLLRNEEPVYLEFSPAEPQLTRLRSGPEPVGEGEE